MKILILVSLLTVIGCKPSPPTQLPEASAPTPPQPSRSKLETINGSPWTEPGCWLLTVDGTEYIIVRTGSSEGGIAIIPHKPTFIGIKAGEVDPRFKEPQ